MCVSYVCDFAPLSVLVSASIYRISHPMSVLERSWHLSWRTYRGTTAVLLLTRYQIYTPVMYSSSICERILPAVLYCTATVYEQCATRTYFAPEGPHSVKHTRYIVRTYTPPGRRFRADFRSYEYSSCCGNISLASFHNWRCRENWLGNPPQEVRCLIVILVPGKCYASIM